MKDLAKNLPSIFRELRKNPFLSLLLLAFSVPILIVLCATKFSSASLEVFLLFAILAVFILIYVAWAIVFISNKNKK